jgi:RND family efflux transporter MFP subunit
LTALAVAAGVAVSPAVRSEGPKPASASAAPPALATLTVEGGARTARAGYDGVVEAVRQTVVAAQVAGAVVQLDARAGDRVAAGQLLMRLDARAADQSAAASHAQVVAAQAQLEVATREVQRQRMLFEQSFISRAALDRAEAEFKASQAQVEAQLAQAGVARTQTAFHMVRAPYAGIVSDVPVTLGDMALPGRPLITIYDPASLRVAAAVPQTVAARLPAGSEPPRVELPSLPPDRQWVTPTRWQQLPTIDAATHTATLRLDLPVALAGATPGQFARVWLPPAATPADRDARLQVPVSAVVRRAEMTALYVLDGQGRPLLRQVRLGRDEAGQVEVLAGLSAGDRVALDPHTAARLR